MDVNKHERLSNITLRHKEKEQLVVRKDMELFKRSNKANLFIILTILVNVEIQI
jgi:hypothetical protein